MIALPDHLRETLFALAKVGVGTASDVAELTGKVRAVESGKLNQLERMGYVKGQRKGRLRYFQLALDSDFMRLIERINKLSPLAQKILAEDLLTAIHNRLKVLEKAEV